MAYMVSKEKMKIKGCIGFSYISGRLCGHMMIVRGKRVINIPLIRPIFDLYRWLYGSKLKSLFYSNENDLSSIKNIQGKNFNKVVKKSVSSLEM